MMFCQDGIVNDRRRYQSAYREAQMEQTRLLILDTLAEMVAEDGFEGIVVNDLAERAGLAARTVYRHFPDRNALHDALSDRVVELVGWSSPDLGDLGHWPQTVESAYRDFDTHEIASTVLAKLNAVRARTSADSARRRAALREQVQAAFPHLDSRDQEAMMAVLLLVGSSRTWLRFKDELDLTGEQSGPVMRWILELVLADVERRGRVVPADGNQRQS
jgi:AcrR family transcriptional regulator